MDGLDQILLKHNCKWKENSFDAVALHQLRNMIRNHFMEFKHSVELSFVPVLKVHFYRTYQKVLHYDSDCDSVNYFCQTKP